MNESYIIKVHLDDDNRGVFVIREMDGSISLSPDECDARTFGQYERTRLGDVIDQLSYRFQYSIVESIHLIRVY